MIRVNLFGVKEDKSGLYFFQGLIYSVIMIFGVISCLFLMGDASKKRMALESQKSSLSAQYAVLVKKTREVEGLKDKEKLLKEKLSTIALLKAKKHGPVHVLYDLATSIPKEAWVGEVIENNGFLEVYGAALDEHVVARFMSSLEKSKYFESVRLVKSELYTHIEVDSKEVNKRGRKRHYSENDSNKNNLKAKLKRFALVIKVKNPLLLKKEDSKGVKKA